MADLLLDIARRPLAKKLVKQLKLPIPLPEPLMREIGPLEAQPLLGHRSTVIGAKDTTICGMIAPALAMLGADLVEPQSLDEPLHSIIFDGSTLRSPSDLDFLYEKVKPCLGALRHSGRVTLLTKAQGACRSLEDHVTSHAIVGFMKSLSKESGRRGITCNAIAIDPQNWDLVQTTWALAFFLSPRSAFISGQIIECEPSRFPEIAETQTGSDTSWVRQFEGKTALVTGAAGGIGAAICRRLAAEGARVIGLDRPSEQNSLQALMDEIQGIPFSYDLGTPDGIDHITHRFETNGGNIDILVHNAGITRDRMFGRMARSDWDDTLKINLRVPMQLTDRLILNDQGLIRLMGPGGRLIFMSSISGIAGNVGQTNYTTAKAGLIGYTKALSQKLAPRQITVNAIAPGFIDTLMTARMPAAVREIARRFNALGQGGKPEDVAEAAIFLASPYAQGISGSVLRVCGHNFLGA